MGGARTSSRSEVKTARSWTARRPVHANAGLRRLGRRVALELVQRHQDLGLQSSETARRLARLVAAFFFKAGDALFEGVGHGDQPGRAIVERHRAQAAVVASSVRPDSSTYERPSR